MTGWEYEDREYWERVYALPENYIEESAVTEGNDGENEFDASMLDACVGRVVLDVGCGDGLFTIRMAERAEEVIGVDFSRIAISEAGKNLANSGMKNLRFEIGNAESLNFQKETFDLVTCRRGPVTDSKVSLREAHRVLKRSGTLMEITIGERDKENLAQVFGRGQMIGSERVSTLKERLLREAGFKKIEISEYTATEIFPTIRDLTIRLKNSPIIPDFNAEKRQGILGKDRQGLQIDKRNRNANPSSDNYRSYVVLAWTVVALSSRRSSCSAFPVTKLGGIQSFYDNSTTRKFAKRRI